MCDASTATRGASLQHPWISPRLQTSPKRAAAGWRTRAVAAGCELSALPVRSTLHDSTARHTWIPGRRCLYRSADQLLRPGAALTSWD